MTPVLRDARLPALFWSSRLVTPFPRCPHRRYTGASITVRKVTPTVSTIPVEVAISA